MKTIINWSLDNRFIVSLFVLILFSAGIFSMGKIKLDAIPDLSDTQVIIQADFPGQPPQIVEDQVTYPLTTKMLSVPYAKNVRGYSFFGFSFVYILFEDGTDLYWARSRVLEYLSSIQSELPQNVKVQLGPDASSVGWVYQYALVDKSGTQTLADLRDLQDFYIRYELTALPGVSEVASIGGFRRQFQIELDPNRLYQYNINLSEVEKAIKRSNLEMGARLFEQAETEYIILARGYIKSIEDIKSINIRQSKDGARLQLKDIASIKEGPDIRRGLAELNGKGEVVGGIVVMRSEEDAPAVIERVKKKIGIISQSLPEGVEIIPTYDRSELIHNAVKNLSIKIFEELLIVSLVTIIFLLHIRSALVAVFVLPISIIISFLILYFLDYTANIMSLGGIAIAIGVMVDASIVIVENTHKHTEKMLLSKSKLNSSDYLQAARLSTLEVVPALFWSMLILVISFLPVFALPEQSGKLFIPLAMTKTVVMSVGALITVVFLPVLITIFIRGKVRKESDHPVSNFLIRIYTPALNYVLNRKKAVLIVSLLVLSLSLFPIFGLSIPFSWFSNQRDIQILKPLGGEFMPPLNEQDLLYMPTTIPGIAVSKAKEILIKTDQLILKIPEVELVFGKVGRADTATDPAPLSMIETTILLKERSKWRPGMTLEKIKKELDRTVRLPGLVNAWTMPIKTRLDMLSTGIKTPLGVKVMGDDLQILQHITTRLEGLISKVEGVSSVFGERVEGANYIVYDLNRENIALHGLQVRDVQKILSIAVGGRKTTDIYHGVKRWSANVRYLRDYRESLDSLKRILVPLPNGGYLPIDKLADIRIQKGPGTIKTENARKTSWLYVDTQSSNLSGLAHRIEDAIKDAIASKRIKWPQAYSYSISGQYEQLQIANERMRVLIPLVLFIVFAILYFHFRAMSTSLIVMSTALLFAPLGGLWFMYLAGYSRSVASDVGFIALIGLAAETGIIMIVYLDQARKDLAEGKLSNVREAILQGAVLRVRPKVMTVATTILALLPIFWGYEPGNIAMRRIAAPMVGGLLSSTLVTLFLIPVLYEWWYTRKNELR